MMNDKSERDDLTNNFKHLAGEYLAQKNVNFIVISTCNNCAVLDRMAIKFDYLFIDEAGAGLEYDIGVALQIKHEGVLVLGDHLQGRPVIESKGHNDFYDQASISGFERALQYTEQERTMLRISYRFGEQIADGVGIFGGYLGLASGKPIAKRFLLPPVEAQYHKAMQESHKKYHRLALNVVDGRSSPPARGNSTVNHANVDAGIAFLMHLVENSSEIITGNDIMIGTPFVSQAEIWRQQLSIRWPESGVEVLTGGISQGKEKRLMVADFTVANETEGAFLGFLTEWNRPNVLESRGQDVLINLFNFNLMRPRLQSLYLQNPTWAYFILDHLNAGDISTVNGSSTLPDSEEEFYGARESWTLTQRHSDSKNLYSTAIRRSQTVPQKGPGGHERYTSLEKNFCESRETFGWRQMQRSNGYWTLSENGRKFGRRRRLGWEKVY
ncbi:hypothetical protein DL98DRAFT_649238 [Cadophora sp. DSE1049]|nr:hypothetical protein DL98DRAFT_649238 [Cadophora sp. DSE1049]